MSRRMVAAITTLLSTSVFLCSCVGPEHGKEHLSDHNRGIATNFVSLVLEKSRKNELFDIDKFLTDNSLTHCDFFQKVLKELVYKENQIHHLKFYLIFVLPDLILDILLVL